MDDWWDCPGTEPDAVRIVQKTDVRESEVEKLIFFVPVADGGLENCIFAVSHTRLCELAGRLTARIEWTRMSLTLASWLCLGCAIEVSVYCILHFSRIGLHLVLNWR